MSRRLAPLTALGLAATLLLGACGSGDDTDDPSSSESSEKSSETRVEISFQDGLYDPNGARVKVGVGDPVVLVIDADAEGSLHVHSTPEQDITFSEGTSEHEVVIDRPGVVEVEAHDPTSIVLQLEVR